MDTHGALLALMGCIVGCIVVAPFVEEDRLGSLSPLLRQGHLDPVVPSDCYFATGALACLSLEQTANA